jgi:hypothetical protein
MQQVGSSALTVVASTFQTSEFLGCKSDPLLSKIAQVENSSYLPKEADKSEEFMLNVLP